MLENISKTAINLANVIIKPLDPDVDRAAFCCGVVKIDNFCRNNARQHHDTDRARVYFALHEEKLVGYYYLVVSSHAADGVSPEAGEKFERVKYAPLVYLGMLGVDESAKKCGLGKLLMLHAMQTTLKIADLAGVYALTLDARDETVAPFYEQLGFSYFVLDAEGENKLKMFYPVREIRAALSMTATAAADGK